MGRLILKILSFGEVLWDVYPDNKFIGGAPLNFAAHSARLGNEVFLLSAVGEDSLAAETLSAVQNFGVKTDFLSVACGKETGKCLVSLDENSVPTYNLLKDVAWDFIDYKGDYNGFDVLYFGTLALRSNHNFDVLNRLVQNNTFKEIFVDVNIRPPYFNSEIINFAFLKATILKISDEELKTVLQAINIDFCDDLNFVVKEICKKFNNIKVLIITRGGKGSLAYCVAENAVYNAEPVKVKVVSTVGAGDSFSAAFLHKYSIGEKIEDCLLFASKISGFVVSQFDAIPDYKNKQFE